MLALLPAGFAIVNDFAFADFNVDHVVVGPTGVWAVETKSSNHTDPGETVLSRDPQFSVGIALPGSSQFRLGRSSYQ